MRWNHKKQVLSILTIAVLALGVLSIGFSYEDASAFHKPQKVKAKVKDATTLDPIKNAQCDFTFGSAVTETASDNTNNGGVAKVKDPDPKTDETTVSVTCTDGTNSATVDAPVKKHGTTVVRILIPTTTTTTTTTTDETTTTTITTTTTETTTETTTTETTTTETTTETTTTETTTTTTT